MKKRILSVMLTIALVLPMMAINGDFQAVSASVGDITEKTVENLTPEQMAAVDRALAHADTYVLTKYIRMGGSHFAYTENLSEEIIYGSSLPEKGEAYMAGQPSRMVLLSIEKLSDTSIKVTEEILVDVPSGIVRDPDVSADGKRVVFSMRKDKYEDFKVYEMTLADRSIKQMTFGDGVADFEPIYLPDGNIMFSSSRIIQTVDCWKVPVSNLYIMGPDGSNIRRIGYDQVHTTTPKLTSDGRVIYTRWDYNDRTQLYIQSMFQMMPDGTNQTELYGNNSNFPTSLVHTREIPGESGRYMSVATGHHTTQFGKLVIFDVNVERNSKDAVSFVFPDEFSSKTDNVDQYGQVGAIYRYPYPIDKDTFFISADLDGIFESVEDAVWSIPSGDAQFSLYLSDGSGTENLIPISEFSDKYAPAQLVPVKTREMFLRSSMVNYAKNTGTYYIGDIYAGEGMTGVERGSAKELRVVALKFRNYAIGATVQKWYGNADPFTPISTGHGAWDVKAVLGSVPIEEDGSVLFEAPADTPIYFQVLDSEGCVIATMRSWTTLMPGESFSCIGCHENKDNVPPANATPTLALKKGVQKISRESWQEDDVYAGFDPYTDEPIGFDYEDEVQKIFDEKITADYSSIEQAMVAVSASNMTGLDTDNRPVAILADDKWEVSFEAQSGEWYAEDFNSSEWSSTYAPFGAHGNGLCEVNSLWESGELYLRRKFTADNYMISEYTPLLEVISTGSYTVYLNGKLAFSGSGASEAVQNFFTDEMVSMLRMGENTIAVNVQAGSSEKPVFSLKLYSDSKPAVLPEGDAVIPDDAILEAYTDTLIDQGTTWTYFMDTTNSLSSAEWYAEDYDTSSWLTGAAPFGNGTVTHNTAWYEKNAAGYLWVRKTFTIPDEATLQKASFRLNAYYAQAPEFYVNGTKFLNNTTSGSGGWYTNWGYRDVYLDEDFKGALKVGTNTIAVRLTNPTSTSAKGGAFDLGLYADFLKYDQKYLIEARSELKYSVIADETGAPENWNTTGFDDSAWTAAEGPIGTMKAVGVNTNVTVSVGNTMYIRQSFEIEDISEYEDVTLKMNLLYDENPSIYLNGSLIHTASDYTTGYTTVDLGSTCTGYLKEGTNVLAAAIPNADGGAGYDMALLASGIVERNLITEAYSETLIDKASSWSYNVAASDTLGTEVHSADFDDSKWSTGTAPFGNGTKRTYTTTWGELQTASYLWVRKHFTVTADMLAKADFSMNAFYAQAPEFYVNGTKFLNNTTSGSGGYYTTWGYRDVYLDEVFKNALVVGDNVISVRLTNPTNANGGYFDLGLYAHFKAYDEKYLVEHRDTWTHIYTAQAPASTWTSNTFDDSSWTVGDAPFGNMKAVGYNTQYKGAGNTLYARTAFNIENLAEYSSCGIKLYALYDEDPKLYLNGNLIWKNDGYNTQYDIFDLGTTISKYFVQGQNVLAMEVPNASGDIGADFALYAYNINVGGEQSSVVTEPSKIYLGGKLMPASRMKKGFPLSYLVLTGSTPSSNGLQWVGKYSNSYINWVSSMSRPEILKPYEFGSKTSTGLFTLLEDYNLTDSELRTIRAWIDLGVPAYGEYGKNVNWSDNDRRDATEKDSKRAFYDMQDGQAKKKLAGLSMEEEITISFSGADGTSVSATDSESAYITVPRKYTAGDSFTVTLPTGHKYLAFTFTPKVAESIIYVPDGVFTYTLPSYASTVFPTEAFTLYTENTASARIPTDDELASVRNLALNPFDLDDTAGIYPHVTVSSRYSSNQCRGRALIDGFEMNLLHYYSSTGLGYPVMSWGLNQGDASDDYAVIDFGRSVQVQSVGIKIRADFDHDDYFTSCTVELSDGTTAELAMKKTSEMMWLEFEEPVSTASIKIKELKNTTTDRWPAITEIKVMGCEASEAFSE